MDLTEHSENTVDTEKDVEEQDHVPPSNVKADLLTITLAAYLSERNEEESRLTFSASSSSL